MYFLRKTWIPLLVLLALLIAAYLAHSRITARSISSFDECVTAGFPVMESYPMQCNANGRNFVQDVTAPTGTSPLPGLSSESGNIRVFSPAYRGTIGLPLIIAGEARAFEGTVEWRLRDADGTELTKGFTTTVGGEAGQFGTFTVRSSYPQPRGAQGTLEVFTTSAQDGSVEGVVSLPVTFPNTPSVTLQAFFSSGTRDPESQRCEVTYPVARRVTKTDAPARTALEELLAGPTPMEANQGYRTSLPPGVRINALSISGGVARVDFSDELLAVASGSCRVSAIRSQIASTLRQFPSVQRVEITIGGRTDALEP